MATPSTKASQKRGGLNLLRGCMYQSCQGYRETLTKFSYPVNAILTAERRVISEIILEPNECSEDI